MPVLGNYPVKAALWMCFAIMSFICLAIGVRQLSPDYSAYKILGVRSFLGTLFLSLLILSKNRSWFLSKSPRKQIIRNGFHFIAQYLWVIGVGLLPLAEVFALEFTTPAWAALIAWFLLGEKLTISRQVALFCGFVGVLMIVKPTTDIFQSASMLVIISAIFFAFSIIFAKQLTEVDNAATILFYFCLIQMPLGLIPAFFHWAPITSDAILWFILVSICGLTAHVGIVKAIQNADIMFIQPIDFMRVPLIALVGYILYAEPIDIWLLFGAAIIFSGNFYNLKEEVNLDKN